MYYIVIRDKILCHPVYLCYDNQTKMYWWGSKDKAVSFKETQIKNMIAYVKHTYLIERASNREVNYEKV